MLLKNLKSISSVWVVGLTMMGALLTLSACNTVEGLGQDTEAAGDAVGDATEDVAN